MPEALIVADTGPLISLSHVEALQVLPALYSQVLIPEAVAAELKASRFESVRDIVDKNPWLQVRAAAKPVDPALYAALDTGEAQAIALALEVDATAH